MSEVVPLQLSGNYTAVPAAQWDGWIASWEAIQLYTRQILKTCWDQLTTVLVYVWTQYNFPTP